MDNLTACGPWLKYSLIKRIWLFLIWWPRCFSTALWKTKYYWYRWLLYILNIKHYILEYDVINWEEYRKHHTAQEVFEEQERTKEYFWHPPWADFNILAGMAHPMWLWYERMDQLERNWAKNKINYPVDWSRKGKPWYPFW